MKILQLVLIWLGIGIWNRIVEVRNIISDFDELNLTETS